MSKCAWFDLDLFADGKVEGCDADALPGAFDCNIVGAVVCAKHECRCSRTKRDRLAKETPMIDDDLQELEVLLNKASPRPWIVDGTQDDWCVFDAEKVIIFDIGWEGSRGDETPRRPEPDALLIVKAINMLPSLLAEHRSASESWTDQPLPEDEAIDAAFPTRTGRHDLYVEAMRLVGARQTKGALVKLVNWLLADQARLRTALDAANDALFDVYGEADDVEHQIACHANTLPEFTRQLSAAVLKAFALIQAVVVADVERAETSRDTTKET